MNTYQITDSPRRAVHNPLRRTVCRMILLLTGLLLCAGAFAQGGRVTLSVSKVPVEKVLRQIERQAECSFLYNKTLIDVNRKVTLSVSGLTLRQTLDRLFAGTNVAYTVRDKQVILSPRPAADVPGVSTPPPAEKTTITGTVSDRSGAPLVGVSILVDGTTSGTTTGIDGSFSLKADAGSVLTVSYLGYETAKVAVTTGRGVYDIVLQESSEMLDDVVIVGFGVQKKASVTGAITSIGGEGLKVNSTVNTSTALAGTVAGINSRQTDGRPGYGTKISIRGMDTPLYIVDGVQRDESQFNNIDANDIESVSILKDASAAIYGLRAANGVVVVKTKSGSKNSRHTVNIKAIYGWQDFFKFPEPASAASYVRTKYQSDVVTGKPNATYSHDEYLKWQAGKERGYEGFNWYDYASDTGAQSYVGANISGGSEKVGYYISLSNTNQEYAIRDFGGFNRTNIQVNVDANVSKRLSLGASLSGRLQTRKVPALLGGSRTEEAEVDWMMFGSYRNLPTVRPYVNDNPLYPAQGSPGYSYTNFAISTRDIAGEDNRRENVVSVNLNATYKFAEWLSLKLVGGYSFQNLNRMKHMKTFSLYDYDKATGDYLVVGGQSTPALYKYNQNTEDYTGQFMLDFKKQFGRHNVALTLGGEASHHSAPGFDFTSQPQTDLTIESNTVILQSMSDLLASAQARAGFIGRFTYDFDSRYLVEVMGRYDGSWKFKPSKRWGFFPSVSAGWRITEEAWWTEEMKRWVSNLKVKASYGMVGDENTSGYSPYDYLEGYNYNKGGAVIDGQWVIGSQYRGLPATELSWQKVKLFNVGLEYGFFDNRLTGELNYFTRTLEGIPSNPGVTIPNEAGFSLPKVNLESQKIKGLDGSIRWSDRVKEFNYTVEGNFTLARKYEWERSPWLLGNSWQAYTSWYEKRYSSQWWGQECIGQFQSWEQIAEYPVDIDGEGNRTLRPGDLIYKDINGDGVINDMDKRPQGYRQGDVPYLNFNFNIALSWKGFDLAMMFTGSAFASLYLDSEMKNPLHGGGNSPAFMLDDMWHLSDINDPNSAYVPGKYPMVIDGNGNHSNYSWDRVSTFWMKNVNYVKLRNLEFGYTLPKSLTRKAGFENVRVFTSMQNLFSIDNLGDIDIDPEISKQSGLQYPTTRVISLGLNLTF